MQQLYLDSLVQQVIGKALAVTTFVLHFQWNYLDEKLFFLTHTSTHLW